MVFRVLVFECLACSGDVVKGEAGKTLPFDIAKVTLYKLLLNAPCYALFTLRLPSWPYSPLEHNQTPHPAGKPLIQHGNPSPILTPPTSKGISKTLQKEAIIARVKYTGTREGPIIAAAMDEEGMTETSTAVPPRPLICPSNMPLLRT